jgi:pyruvate/2-oxoacid:ferredoxin oxidoreductase alpha subunit
VVYDPDNHSQMIALRAEKIERIASDIPNVEVEGPDEGDLLIVGWGSTLGAITAAMDESSEIANEAGATVSRIHLRHLNPLPSNLGDVLGRFKRVLLPEFNNGKRSIQSAIRSIEAAWPWVSLVWPQRAWPSRPEMRGAEAPSFISRSCP